MLPSLLVLLLLGSGGTRKNTFCYYIIIKRNKAIIDLKFRLHKKGLAAADVEYPAYGVTGPNKDISPSGDRRLAQSAQMYHYQHQKQQIIAMENRTNQERNGTLSDVESDEENEEGDYTVYECPGLAPVSCIVIFSVI